MHLTQKQESLISQYLRDLSRSLDANLSDQTRERGLRQVQTRIYQELERIDRGSISDDDVARVLSRQPGLSAAQPAETPVAAGNGRPSPRDRARSPEPVWLGVCAYNAERVGAEPWMVRLGVALFGLVAAPLALLLYVAGYAEYYFNLHEKERPAIDWGRLAIRAAVPVVVLILLRWGSGKLLALVGYGHERIFKEPLPALGEWDWFRFNEGKVFALAFLLVLPLSILSGLPLANGWGHSLKRLAQALVALYVVALCFGVASVLAGIILDRVQAYMQ